MSLSAQIYNHLQELKLPPPSQPWLQNLISARNHPPPLPSIVMTVKTRLLASDLTTPGLLDPRSVSAISLPSGITNPAVKETRLSRNVYVQVCDIEDLTKSRWEQVEQLEAVERGEQTRGRDHIRLPLNSADAEEQQNLNGEAAQPEPGGAVAASKKATHRLVLQDCQGRKVYGLELIRVPGIAIGMLNIGEKILLTKGTLVDRGTILLEPTACHLLGGRIDSWQRAWLSTRLERLKEAVRLDHRT